MARRNNQTELGASWASNVPERKTEKEMGGYLRVYQAEIELGRMN